MYIYTVIDEKPPPRFKEAACKCGEGAIAEWDSHDSEIFLLCADCYLQRAKDTIAKLEVEL